MHRNNMINILLMKVGTHGDETFDSIIKRKKCESRNGVFYWGYGGTLCHPFKQVQPFARDITSKGGKVFLVMSFTPSPFKSKPTPATHLSLDNISWHPIPAHVHITGSKYALVCKNIRLIDEDIDLTKFVVAIGPSKGKLLANHLKGRVDKACAKLSIESKAAKDQPKLIKISYIAELVKPFAVVLASGDENMSDNLYNLPLFGED